MQTVGQCLKIGGGYGREPGGLDLAPLLFVTEDGDDVTSSDELTPEAA